MSDRQSSSLFKAASEPDLTSLPSPLPSPPPIRIAAPARSPSLRRMLDDADAAYPISSTPRRSPLHTPPLSPARSPRPARQPSPRPARQPSPRPARQSSPPPVYHQPQSAVSFSEYVASELARDQSLQQQLGVHFAPADPDPRASPPRRAAPDPFDSDHSQPADLRLESVDIGPEKHRLEIRSEIIRSETEPDLTAAEFGKPSPSLSARARPPAEPPSHIPHPEPEPPAFTATTKGRYGKLDCLQVDQHGEVTERKLSRADILNEARATLSEAQPSPTAMGRWLTDAGQTPSPEFAQFTGMLQPDAATSRKAAQKALRDYLRNSLQARDIRQVDPAFAARPALWVRHSALVVSLEGLRAIILHDKMFLFDPDKERTRQLVFIAKQSILARPDAENLQPFEFKALEGILIFLAMGLEREFGALKPEIEEYLHQLPNELTTKMLEELRLKKQQLNHFHSRASSVRTILENLLDEDEDMANMYLTEKHASRNYLRSSVDHSEVETLLEAYLQVIDEHVNHATLLNDAIDDTEDLVMIHLDTLRNRLLSVELALSVVGMMFGFGGVISGMFGMNIQIPLFEPGASQVSFFVVVAIILTSVVAVSWLVLVMLRRRGLYSFY